MDITKLSLTELKALAFDLITQQQVINQNLNVVTQEIQKRGAIDLGTMPQPTPQEISQS